MAPSYKIALAGFIVAGLIAALWFFLVPHELSKETGDFLWPPLPPLALLEQDPESYRLELEQYRKEVEVVRFELEEERVEMPLEDYKKRIEQYHEAIEKYKEGIAQYRKIFSKE